MGQTGTQTVTANGGFTINGGRLRVQTNGNITFNGNNITINNGNGDISATLSNGVIHMNTTGAGRSSVVNLSNSTITVTAGTALYGSQGVTAQTNPAGSNSGLTQVNATNVALDMQTVNSRAGLNANSGGTGTADIEMVGGWVKTNGAYSNGTTGIGTPLFFAGARANSAAGNTIVNISGGGWIESVNRASGIEATSAGNGNASVTLASDAGGSIEGTGPSRVILTTGTNAYGIYAEAQNGNIAVNNLSVLAVGIETRGNNADGILASIVSGGSGSITIDNRSGIATSGSSSNAIHAAAQTGGVTITNQAALATQGTGADGVNALTTSGAINITNNAAVTTSGASSDGLDVTTASGIISVTNSGAITTNGASAYGIRTQSSAGNEAVLNTGDIVTNGSGAYGISVGNAANGSGSARLESHANIVVNGPSGGGVAGLSATAVGNATIVATGNITTPVSSAGSFSVAIEARSRGGTATVNYSNGIAHSGGGAAIVAWDQNSGTGVSGQVTVGPDATLMADHGWAVSSLVAGGNQVTTDATAVLNGLQGVQLNSGVAGSANILDHAGLIEVTSDEAVQSDAAPGTTTAINNTGTIFGYMTVAGSVTTVNNSGIWNLRNFADTDGDGVRDTLAVAVSDFGTSGANIVNNTGTIALLGAGSDPVTTLDTAGMYLPKGYAFNTPAISGPVQGQLLGVQTFNNSGVIDLTANPVAGDVLVISGGQTAGQDGGGVFVANGGTVRLNTVLNDGDAHSQSDVLVVDSTRLGSGPTALAVTSVGTPSGALTRGDGILLIEVLNKTASPDGVFTLGNRVVAGAYEYLLFHNGVDADAADGNWYLRNVYNAPPDDPTPIPPPIIRPEVPVTTVIPPLAIEYGYTMLGTMHERGGEQWSYAGPAYEERSVWCKGKNPHNPDAVIDPNNRFKCIVRVPVAGSDQTRWAKSGWVRLIGDRGIHNPDNYFRRGPNYDYTFGGIEAGLDVYAREQADGTLDKAGVYVGYGRIWSDVKGQPGAFYGGKAGTVDMDAYTLGGYWTHLSSQGWYTDAVVQGTWYAADARSVLGTEMKPKGFGILGSLEGGYSFKLGSGWALEPQAQIVYQNVSFDHIRTDGAFVSFDEGDSLRGRLGLRLAKTWNRAEEGKKPRLVTGWVRANLWHEFLGKTKTSWGSLDGQNMVPFHSYLGGTWGEIGAGVTAQMTDKVNLFATAAYQHSLDNHGREGWDGRIGATMKW